MRASSIVKGAGLVITGRCWGGSGVAAVPVWLIACRRRTVGVLAGRPIAVTLRQATDVGGCGVSPMTSARHLVLFQRRLLPIDPFLELAHRSSRSARSLFTRSITFSRSSLRRLSASAVGAGRVGGANGGVEAKDLVLKADLLQLGLIDVGVGLLQVAKFAVAGEEITLVRSRRPGLAITCSNTCQRVGEISEKSATVCRHSCSFGSGVPPQGRHIRSKGNPAGRIGAMGAVAAGCDCCGRAGSRHGPRRCRRRPPTRLRRGRRKPNAPAAVATIRSPASISAARRRRSDEKNITVFQRHRCHRSSRRGRTHRSPAREFGLRAGGTVAVGRRRCGRILGRILRRIHIGDSAVRDWSPRSWRSLADPPRWAR